MIITPWTGIGNVNAEHIVQSNYRFDFYAKDLFSLIK